MSGKCPGITQKGTACKGTVPVGATHCPAHDPAQSERRKRDASNAARLKARLASIEGFAEMRADLKQLYMDVKLGKANRSSAAVAAQIAGVWIKAAEAEIKLRQFQEIDLVEFTQLREEIRELQRQSEEARHGGMSHGVG